MSYSFHVLFPAAMIVTPALLLGLWCALTGVAAMRRLLLATAGALVLFAAYVAVSGPAASVRPLVTQAWALGPFFALCFGFAVPEIRRAFAALPDAPRSARLVARRVELFPGAYVAPVVAWAALVAPLVARGGPSAWTWLNPALGLAILLVLPRCLRLGVREPEPLGGEDPGGLASAYESFRRKRIALLYALFVLLGLALAAAPLLPAANSGGAAGAALGCAMGAWGALLGTWADAQRYLLRRRLSGFPPPGDDRVQSAA